MANPLATAVGVVRRNPALAIAGAGVGAVVLIASRRKPVDAELEAGAVQPGRPSSNAISGYGSGLTTGVYGPSASENPLVLHELSRIREAIQAAQVPPTPAPPLGNGGSPRPPEIPRPSTRPPIRQPTTPGPIAPAPRAATLTDAEVNAIVARLGHPEWADGRVPAYDRGSEAAVAAWVRRAEANLRVSPSRAAQLIAAYGGLPSWSPPDYALASEGAVVAWIQRAKGAG